MLPLTYKIVYREASRRSCLIVFMKRTHRKRASNSSLEIVTGFNGTTHLVHMDCETTEVRVEEMDWKCDGYQESEPMDWEDIPEVRSPKRSKVSDLSTFKSNIPLQPSTSPQLKKQGEETQPSPKIISPLISPFIVRCKIRTRQKVSPQVSSSTSDRPILKARRPLSN
ncbi:hypothetical protein NPIL_621161 [Nephila pilipes]|uniref:Uncharacterized protein n=1 Tax=Nephila pilipes TaxID=299642 RepID=A0A8X6U4Z9_NEPPI|nr:hypothetical protein NPIL_621161 [Nephila pilipes]